MNTFELPPTSSSHSSILATTLLAPRRRSEGRGRDALGDGDDSPTRPRGGRPASTARASGKRCDEVREGVIDSLMASGYAALGFIGCEVKGDQVILNGTVPSYHLKQLAQVLAQRVDGVGRIQNCLNVRWRA